MRAGLTSVILRSALVNTPAKRWKPGQKYSRQLRLKLSFPQIYSCQQMRGCNFKCCHAGDLSPDSRSVFCSFPSARSHIQSSAWLSDVSLISDWMFGVFFLILSQASLKSDFLDVRICKNLWQNPRRKISQRTAALSLLTRQKNHLVREDLDPLSQTVEILFNVVCWADFNSMTMLVLVRWHEFVPFYYLL